MKIICVGMNYAQHNEELKHKIGEVQGVSANFGKEDSGRGVPTLFLKPETALTRSDWPFFVPDWSDEVEYETELVVRIGRLGKSIPTRYAHRYYDEVTLGIDFTARDLQRQLKAKGLPWEIAKGFDGAAFCGQTWMKKDELPGIEHYKTKNGEVVADMQQLHFEMQLNGETRQVGHTADMLHTVDEIVAYASQFFLLKQGDLIFTGTPAGVGKVKEGDVITGMLQGVEVLCCRCK